MYRTITIVIALVLLMSLMTGCSSLEGKSKAVTAGGSTSSDALLSAGVVVSDKAEVGITAVAFNGPERRSYAVGPYGVYLVPVPADIADDWQPFCGGALLLNGSFDPIPKAVVGVIYKPTDVLSPVMMVEKAWPSGSVNTGNVTNRSDDVYTWLSLRCKIK